VFQHSILPFYSLPLPLPFFISGGVRRISGEAGRPSSGDERDGIEVEAKPPEQTMAAVVRLGWWGAEASMAMTAVEGGEGGGRCWCCRRREEEDAKK
jgi:hypothetical protein